MSKNKSLGKLIGVYGTSPVLLQRAAIISFLAFLFFLIMILIFYVRQNIGYFVLASAFMVLYVFTLIGFILKKRDAVNLFAKGLVYRKNSAKWTEIDTVKTLEKLTVDGSVIVKKDGTSFNIPASIGNLDNLNSNIKQRMVA